MKEKKLTRPIYTYMPNLPEDKGRAARVVKRGALSMVSWFFHTLMLIVCAVLTAALMFWAGPKTGQYLLGWVALAPFVFGIRKTKTFFGAGLYSLFTGLVMYGALFYWVYYTCLAGGVERNLSLLAVFGIAFVVALQFVLFGVGAFILRKLNFTFALFAAAAWVSFEFLNQLISYKYFGAGGLTMLGYTQSYAPQMIQIASYTGVYGVSFALAFFGAEIGTVFSTKDFASRALSVFAAAFVFAGVFIYGKAVLNEHKTVKAQSAVRVAVLQPNIDLYKKWDAAYAEEIEQILVEQLDEAAAQAPAVIAWPESALPASIYEDEYFAWVSALAQKTQAYQLIGSDRVEGGAQYVSAYLINPAGELGGVYDKKVLVPFGEYIPFGRLLKKFNIKELNALGGFTPGNAEQAPLYYKDIMFGANLCYESFFPSLWSEAAHGGAKFFINLTNDGWYLNTSAPYINFGVNIFRAVETGRPVVRAANTGLSGLIDRYGRVIARTAVGVEDVLVFDVPVQNDTTTFYNEHGDLFALVCIALAFTGIGGALVFLNE